MKNFRALINLYVVSLFLVVTFASVAQGQTSGSGLLFVYGHNLGPGGRSPVVVYNRATGAEIRRFYPGASWGGGPGCIFGRGIAYDPTDGNLWVTMQRGSCITPDGGTTGDGSIHKINAYEQHSAVIEG